MSFAFTHSTAPGDHRDGGAILYLWKEALKAQGWTHVASGDGLALFSTVTDQITHGSFGAGGFDNTRAHITLQQPTGGSGAYAGTRQLTLQIGDGAGAGLGNTVRIVYSPAGTAVTGACDANTVPTFSDEVILAGGGTPAAPTFQTVAGTSGAISKLHIVVGNAAENFGFWLTVVATTADTNSWTFIFDPLLHPLTGDDAPFAFFYGLHNHPTGGVNPFRDTDTGYMNVKPDPVYIIGKFATGGYQAMSVYGGMHGLGGGAYDTPTNSRNNRDDLHPMSYSRHGANGGYKGYSSLMRRTGVSRADRSVFNVDVAGDRVKFGATANCHTVLKAWDNTVP